MNLETPPTNLAGIPLLKVDHPKLSKEYRYYEKYLHHIPSFRCTYNLEGEPIEFLVDIYFADSFMFLRDGGYVSPDIALNRVVTSLERIITADKEKAVLFLESIKNKRIALLLAHGATLDGEWVATSSKIDIDNSGKSESYALTCEKLAIQLAEDYEGIIFCPCNPDMIRFKTEFDVPVIYWITDNELLTEAKENSIELISPKKSST